MNIDMLMIIGIISIASVMFGLFLRWYEDHEIKTTRSQYDVEMYYLIRNILLHSPELISEGKGGLRCEKYNFTIGWRVVSSTHKNMQI